MAWRSMNACCSACGRSSAPRPSTVVMRLPSTAQTGVSQACTGRPSMRTLHAPHDPAPQPNRGPFNPQACRNTDRRGDAASASTDRTTPLISSSNTRIRLLDLSTRHLDDLCPFHDVVLEVCLELRGGHDQRFCALLGPGSLYVLALEDAVDLGIKLLDDRL